MPELFYLEITSAVAIAGQIKKAGSIVQVNERTAKELLQIGKAVPASSAKIPQPAPTTPAAEPEPEQAEQEAEQAEQAAEPEQQDKRTTKAAAK